jgi:hypothetical protein
MCSTFLIFFSVIRSPIAAWRQRPYKKRARLADCNRDRIVAWHFF